MIATSSPEYELPKPTLQQLERGTEPRKEVKLMPFASIGQQVQVDISGLSAPGVQIGGGVSASGTIIAIDPIQRLITVRLDVAFSGQNVITVPPERVSA
jgi:hypothetical protein